jgi:AraC family transcriptional regulator
MVTQRTAGILNFGNEFGKCFQLGKAPSLLLDSKARPQMAVTRLTLPYGLPHPAAPVRPERGFTISVHLQQPSCQGWGTWVDGKFMPIDHWEQGGIGIYDLESNPMALRTSAFDSVHFNLPRATLDAFAIDCNLRLIQTLASPEGKRDDVLFGLAKFILPWVGDGVRICGLMFDYYVLMFCSHVATTYGNVKSLPRDVGGLAQWQKRRVIELIEAELHGELRASVLATECGLSVSQFSRSFKKTFGVPVHRYVIRRRVECAKSLLKSSSMPLAEIALHSGFSDQPAFSRTFSALVGTSPKRWINEYRSVSRLAQTAEAD